MKKGDTLPNQDHCLRYIAPSHIDKDIIQSSGFFLRPHEIASSVNWLEYFQGDLEAQVQTVRAASQIKYAASGRLARVSIEKAATLLPMLTFIYDPIDKDPSHALIYGIPQEDTAERDLLEDMIRLCIASQHPTKF